MMIAAAVFLLPHLCVVLGAFTQTRSQASLADQDDYIKHPQQQQQPLDEQELKVVDFFDITSSYKLLQELEELIGNLSSEQLEELQDIMERDHDEMTEFDLISGELAEMGVDEEDIADLKLLGGMMHEFVSFL